MVNRETLSKDQEKKLFSQFVEDFNTGEFVNFYFRCSKKAFLIDANLLNSYPSPREVLREWSNSDAQNASPTNFTGRLPRRIWVNTTPA